MTSEQLAEQTLTLCQMRSPIGDERVIADYIENWAHSVFPVEQIFRHSHSFVLGDLADSRPTVALIGHLDTVPGSPEAIQPHWVGDRLYGLGSSDMKGGLAVMMSLAQTLPLSNLPYNLVLILYEREEGPFLESGLGPLMEKKPQLGGVKLGIAFEPTDNLVQVGCVGSLHAKLRFRGQRAHSARPWQGKNAIHAAGLLLAELDTLERHEVRVEGFPFYEVFSVTTAKGGHAGNVLPDLFELNLNYRFAPGKNLEAAQEDVRRLVKDRAEIEFTDLAPSGRVCSENAVFKRLLDTTGLAAQSKQAWTDVARFSSFGIDAVNFGPGETAQAHQANESASIEALGIAYQKMSQFLQNKGGRP